MGVLAVSSVRIAWGCRVLLSASVRCVIRVSVLLESGWANLTSVLRLKAAAVFAGEEDARNSAILGLAFDSSSPGRMRDGFWVRQFSLAVAGACLSHRVNSSSTEAQTRRFFR